MLWAGVEPSLFGMCHQVGIQPLKLFLDFLLPPPWNWRGCSWNQSGGREFSSRCLLRRSPFGNVEGKFLRLISTHNATAVFFPVPLFNDALNSYYWFLCPRWSTAALQGYFHPIRNIYSTELHTEDWVCLLLSPSLSTLPLLCASVEGHLFLKHALLFEVADVFVAHFTVMSKGQTWTGTLLLHKARDKVVRSPGKLREAGRQTVLFFSLLEGWRVAQGVFGRVRN